LVVLFYEDSRQHGGFFAQMTNDNSYPSYPVSIRKQVCKLLDENQLLTAKMLSALLKLPYKKYKQTLTNYRNFWKYNHENERGSKCSSFHCYKAVVVLKPEEQPKREPIGKWVVSRARNKFFVWRGKLGRVVWFGTGRVLLFVKRPGNLGKAKQLFCDAFVGEGLITDLKVLNAVMERVRPRSCHFPYETSERLPKFEIRDFVESHGVLIKVGDRSHPNAVEVIAEYSEQLERLGDLAEGFVKFMAEFHGLLNGGSNSTPEGKKDIGVV